MYTYYKIYHYSNQAGLNNIDPEYYGSGVTQGAECKRGKTGLNKTYFYTEDKPETCLRSTKTRYEIYLPSEWKERIYDRSKDPLRLYARVTEEIQEKYHRLPYNYELTDGVEHYIKDLNYIGWTCSDHTQLPHVIVLFYPLSTDKPSKKSAYVVYDWSENVIENHLPRSLNSRQHFALFAQQNVLSGRDEMTNKSVFNLDRWVKASL